MAVVPIPNTHTHTERRRRKRLGPTAFIVIIVRLIVKFNDHFCSENRPFLARAKPGVCGVGRLVGGWVYVDKKIPL